MSGRGQVIRNEPRRLGVAPVSAPRKIPPQGIDDPSLAAVDESPPCDVFVL